MEITTNPIENQMVSQGRYAYGSDEKNQVSISLKTQEGDTVKLTFNSASSYSESASETKSQDGTTSQEFSAKAMSASSYSMSVQGDLNEKEMAAIKKMADSISPIAQSFFSNSDFSLKDAAQSLDGAMGEIQSVHVRLEQTVTETLSVASSSGQSDNAQPSTTVAEKAPSPPAVAAKPSAAPSEPAKASDEDKIRNPEALAKAVVGSVFQKEGEKAAKNDPAILHSLDDLVRYLQSQLSQFFTPLKSQVGRQSPAPVEPKAQPEAKKDAVKPINIAA